MADTNSITLDQPPASPPPSTLTLVSNVSSVPASGGSFSITATISPTLSGVPIVVYNTAADYYGNVVTNSSGQATFPITLGPNQTGNTETWVFYALSSNPNLTSNYVDVTQASGPPPSSGYTVNVTVENTTGFLYSGASVQLYDMTTSTVFGNTTTNSNGVATFSSVPNGNYLVAVTYSTNSGSTTITVNGAAVNAVVYL
jgi:hypothetical protein